jgi:hypothetical protein
MTQDGLARLPFVRGEQGMEAGTGIQLIRTDALSRGVMVAVGAWALASAALLIVEAVRARRRVSALFGPRDDPGPQRTAERPNGRTDGLR